MERSSLYIDNHLFFAEVECQLRQGKQVRIRVRGNSMLPFLHDEDEALLALPQTAELRKGKIVVAHTDMGIVLHRIIRVEGEKITLLGDGNVARYEHTTPEQVIAVVKHYYHNGHTCNPDSWRMRVEAFGWYLIRPYRGYVLEALRRINRIRNKR